MKKSLALLLLLVTNIPVYAATLIIPQDFEFIAVDGKDVKRSIMSHVDSINLDAGEHKIALRYKDVVTDSAFGYEEVINSRPFVISLTVEHDAIYQLSPSNEIYKKDKHQYADNPEVVIKRQDGSKVSYARVMKQNESQWAKATRNDKPSETDPGSISVQPVVTDTKTVTNPVISIAPRKSVTTIPAADSNDPATKLKYWWKQADKKTRQEFMGWIVEE